MMPVILTEIVRSIMPTLQGPLLMKNLSFCRANAKVCWWRVSL